MVTRRVMVGVVVGVLLLLGIGLGLWRSRRTAATRAAGVAAASLERCVLGEPLAPGETASARVHRIALGNPPKDWPSRCNHLALGLGAALDRAGREEEGREVLAKWGNGFELEAMEEAPWEMSLPPIPAGAQPAPDVPPAPPPREIPDERAAAIASGALFAKPESDAMPGQRLHALLSPSTFCSFAVDLRSAECGSLAARAPQGAQELVIWPPTDDGAPSWVTDLVLPGGRVQRMFRADTGLLLDTRDPNRALHAYGYVDGSVLTLGPPAEAETGLELSHWKGKTRGQPLSVDMAPKSLALYGDRMLWVRRADDDLDHLYSTRVSRDPLALGEPEDHGALDVAPSSFEACRTGQALAVALIRGADARAMFFSDRGASKLHQAKLRADASVVHRAFACGRDDLSIARVVTRKRARSSSDAVGFIVQHSRCTESGCSSQEVDLDRLFEGLPEAVRPPGEKGTEVVAGGLGGKLLIVWRSRSRGVRARLAGPGELAKTEDLLVYDDGLDGGQRAQKSTVTRMALHVRRDAAVLLLERTLERGVTALRIGSDGDVGVIAAKK